MRAHLQPSSLTRFRAMTPEQLQAQPTRALMAALEGSRALRVCDCGHQGCDGGMTPEDYAFNAAQSALFEACKAILATRERVPRSTQPVKKPEKKPWPIKYPYASSED